VCDSNGRQQISVVRSDNSGVVAHETSAFEGTATYPRYAPSGETLLRSSLRLGRMDQSLIPFVVLAPPAPVQPHLAPAHPSQAELEVGLLFPSHNFVNLTSKGKRRHWAEKIFDEAPHSTTGLRHRRE
jgi:hypothetical protein